MRGEARALCNGVAPLSNCEEPTRIGRHTSAGGQTKNRRPRAQSFVRDLLFGQGRAGGHHHADLGFRRQRRFGSVELESDAVGRPYPMEAGAHRLLVDAHGRSQSTYDIELKAGEQQSLEVSPGKPTEGPEATAPVDGRRTRGYVLAGVGAAGVSVGLLAGALVLSKKSTADDHCDDSLRICDQIVKDANDSGRTWATVSTVGWLVGAAGLGAGAYFLLKSDPGSETAAAVRIDPRATSFSMLHRW